MKKILIIHHGKGIGGGLIALVGLVDELKLEYEVEVLSIFDSVAVDYLRNNNIEVFLPKTMFYRKIYSLYVHSEASYFNFINFVYDIFSLITFLLSKYFFAKRELRFIESKYDLIYLNSTFIADWSKSAKRFNKKVIIHVREPIAKGVMGFRYKIIRNSIKKYCDKIIAISYDNAKRINLINKTTVVYDPIVSRNRSTVSHVELDANLKYFLYLGGHTRIKGFEQLVKSLDFLNDDIKIFFLGGEVFYNSNRLKKMLRVILDPYYNKQLKLIEKLNKSDKILNVGLTENVFEYYKKSIALISPFSKPHASLPILESFSLGIPVIVSNVDGMDELVNNKNGMFFQNHDSVSLAKRINEMSLLGMKEYQEMKKKSLDTFEVIINRKETVLSGLKNV